MEEHLVGNGVLIWDAQDGIIIEKFVGDGFSLKIEMDDHIAKELIKIIQNKLDGRINNGK